MTIDVSHHQAHIDWAQVKAAGVTEVFIKLTEGIDYIDPMAIHHASGAQQQGIKIGYYHFASLNNPDVIKDASMEASDFMQAIARMPAPSLPLVLDIEQNSLKLPKDKTLLWIKTFFQALEQAGHKDHVLYSYTPFLNANLPPTHDLGNIRLWLAAYVSSSKPKMPKGWTKYWLWQYSSKGKIKGISGNVDMNRYPSQG